MSETNDAVVVAKNDAISAYRQSQYIEAVTSGEWTPELMRVVRETVAKGADNAELAMFAHVCARTKLDPFTKQIHFTKRFDRRVGKEVAVIITGIDGFRVIANRSGKFRGVVGPMWCGKDGVWRDVWLESTPPFAAKVGVRHAEFDEPVFAIARWSASCPSRDGRPTGLWADRDAEQLAKCAEALALRMAFPNDLSGLYTTEEMSRFESESRPVQQRPVSVARPEHDSARVAQAVAQVAAAAVPERAPESKPTPKRKPVAEEPVAEAGNTAGPVGTGKSQPAEAAITAETFVNDCLVAEGKSKLSPSGSRTLIVPGGGHQWLVDSDVLGSAGLTEAVRVKDMTAEQLSLATCRVRDYVVSLDSHSKRGQK